MNNPKKCEKISFSSEADAQMQVDFINLTLKNRRNQKRRGNKRYKGDHNMKRDGTLKFIQGAYKCPHCEFWHVTSKTQY